MISPTVTIDTESNTPRVSFSVSLNSVEDAGDAVVALKNAARIAWPTIIFAGEPGFDEVDEGSLLPRVPIVIPGSSQSANSLPTIEVEKPKHPVGKGGAPKPGKFMDRVIEAAFRLKTTDSAVISADLNSQRSTTAAWIATARRGGHFTALEGEA